jgi:L-lactate permease
MKKTLLLVVLGIATAWNAMSVYGSLYPFLYTYFPGPWIALNEHRMAFIAFDLALALGVALCLWAFFLYPANKPRAISVALVGLALATLKGFANTYLVSRYVGSMTPSIIGGIVSLVAAVIVALLGRERSTAKD